MDIKGKFSKIFIFLFFISLLTITLVNANESLDIDKNITKEESKVFKLLSGGISEDVPLEVELLVDFETEVQAGTFMDLIVLIKTGDNNSVINIKKQIRNNQLIITPINSLLVNQEYEIMIPGYSLKNEDNEPIRELTIFKFKTIDKEVSMATTGEVLQNLILENKSEVPKTEVELEDSGKSYNEEVITEIKNDNLEDTTNLELNFQNATSTSKMSLNSRKNLKIYAGMDSSAVITPIGELWRWGTNYAKQLGVGDFDEEFLTPTKVTGYYNILDNANTISGGYSSSIVLDANGKLFSWGFNYLGILGLGMGYIGHENYVVISPTELDGLSDMVDVRGKFYHTLGVRADGTLWGWGSDNVGSLGMGSVLGFVHSPQKVVGVNGNGFLTNVVSADVGETHSIALRSDGSVVSFGGNNFGQLGNGTLSSRVSPTQVLKSPSSILTDIIAISSGNNFNLALSSNGTVWSWGQNNYGQLGDGTTTNRNYPIQVKGKGGSGLLSDVIAISSGGSHSLALKSDGTVWSWGRNSNGQLGNNTNLNQLFPVQVISDETKKVLENVKSIKAGESHNIALTEKSVLTWGRNTEGQLGNGTKVDSKVAIKIPINIMPQGMAKNYIYDEANRLIVILFTNGENQYRQDFVYDQNGNLVSKNITLVQ